MKERRYHHHPVYFERLTVMNCDDCNILLEEENTFERILCKKCIDTAEKVYCCKCYTKIDMKNFLTDIRDTVARCIGPMNEKRLRFLLIILFFIGLISISNRHLGFLLLVGYFAIPLMFALVVIVVMLFSLGIYKFGIYVNKLIGTDLDENYSPDEPLFWVLGMITLLSPVLAYGLGKLVMFLGSRLL